MKKKTFLKRGLKFIKSTFAKVDFKKLGPVGFSKKPGNEATIVRFGPKGGEEPVFKRDGSGLLKSFTDRFKTALGPSSEELLVKENQEVRKAQQSLKEAQKQLQKEQNDALEKVQNLKQRYEQVEAKRKALKKEQGSSLENQIEKDTLKMVEKNLLRNIKNEEAEIKALQKQQQQQKEQAQKLANVGKLRI